MHESELVIQKLKNFDGSLISTKWKVPKTKRQFAHSLNRILKLYYAINKRQLYYPELVAAVKELAVYFKLYIIKNRPDKILYYMTELEKVIDFEPPVHFVRIEQLRIKESRKCSVCRVPLVNPAYLVYIDENQTEVRSEPTGIFCLRQLHGYLDNLRDSLKVEWEIEAIRREVDEHGGQALRAS
jgi:hypothetical protein